MQNYTLDPYQQRLMSTEIHSTAMTYILGDENTGKTTALIQKIYRDIQDGKRTIVFVHKEDHLMKLADAIQSSKLAPYFGVFEPKHRFDVEQVARLRTMERIDKSEEFQTENMDVLYDFQHLQEEINYNYKKLSEPFFGQMSWSQLVRQFIIAKSVCPDHIIDARLIQSEFEFSKNEYWLIKGRIEKAAALFTPEFMHREKLFRDDVFLDLDHPAKLESILEKLLAFDQELCMNSAALKAFFSRKIEETEKRLASETASIVKTFNTAIRNINLYFTKEDQYASELKIFGFGQKYRAENKLAINTIHAQLAELKALIERSEWLNIQTSAFPEIMTDDILQSESFEVLDQLKTDGAALIDKEIKLAVRRMNLQNQEDEEIAKYEDEIDELIGLLNNSGLFRQLFEMHALNIHAKYIQLDQIKIIIRKAIAYLRHDKAYYSWMHLWVNLPEKTKMIIHQLHDLPPQNWIKAFDRWYLFHMLKIHIPDPIVFSEKSLSVYFSLENEYDSTQTESVYKEFKMHAQEAIKNLRQKSSVMYRDLFKKQLDKLDFRQLFEENINFIATVFPCSIMHIDLLKDMQWTRELPFDNVVFFHTRQSDITNCPFKPDTQFYHLLTKTSAQIPEKGCAIPMQIPYPSEWVKLNDPSPGKVLKQAQFFARAICALRSNLYCYLTKAETLISLLPDTYNREFMDKYEKVGLKQFWSNQNLMDQLTECFLRKDKSKKMLLLDGLISPEDYPLIDWQLQLIRLLEQAGVSMVNVWTIEKFAGTSKELLTRELISVDANI